MNDLKVPEEISDLFLESRAAMQLRDKCITMFFFARKSIYYGKMSAKLSIKAWKMVNDLYPETANGNWEYNYTSKVIKQVKNETNP
jgi:hypothetical protein